MLQLKFENNKFIINPHIRVDGSWNKYSYCEEIINKDIVEKHTVKIVVRDNLVQIVLNNNDSKQYYIPTHHNTKINSNKKQEDPLNLSSVNKIHFYSNNGKIGFRCYGSEWVKILNFEIVPIRWWQL